MFSEVQFKLPWEWNAHNITESRKFLERNKNPKFVNTHAKHRILANI
jgi:hypothetical protein